MQILHRSKSTYYELRSYCLVIFHTMLYYNYLNWIVWLNYQILVLVCLFCDWLQIHTRLLTSTVLLYYYLSETTSYTPESPDAVVFDVPPDNDMAGRLLAVASWQRFCPLCWNKCDVSTHSCLAPGNIQTCQVDNWKHRGLVRHSWLRIWWQASRWHNLKPQMYKGMHVNDLFENLISLKNYTFFSEIAL